MLIPQDSVCRLTPTSRECGIPMIISGPGLKIGRDKKNRSIVDIAPTVIELAEGNLNEFPINFSGRSMKNAISNNNEDKISENNYFRAFFTAICSHVSNQNSNRGRYITACGLVSSVVGRL